MNPRIKELMEQVVIKMLEDDLKDRESIISSQDGKTIITLKHNSLVTLLLYLQMTGATDLFELDRVDVRNNLEMNQEDEKKKPEVTPEIDEEEHEQVLEMIRALQVKNEELQRKIAEVFQTEQK